VQWSCGLFVTTLSSVCHAVMVDQWFHDLAAWLGEFKRSDAATWITGMAAELRSVREFSADDRKRRRNALTDRTLRGNTKVMSIIICAVTRTTVFEGHPDAI